MIRMFSANDSGFTILISIHKKYFRINFNYCSKEIAPRNVNCILNIKVARLFYGPTMYSIGKRINKISSVITITDAYSGEG
jgi:hypothetical protein